ncbi:MAG: ISAs1 family transposase [Proteobacteria bacterium]|nr:ISAs1 family transposase [Pseudomonadota bacterium]
MLAQVKTAAKSNEITAIPQVLEMMDVTGAIVTIDAMGCQTKIARQIIRQKAVCCHSRKISRRCIKPSVLFLQ